MTDEEAERAGLELLGDDLQRFQDLHDNPDAFIGGLEEDLAFQVAIARADMLPRLQHWFSPSDGDGWAFEPEHSGPIGNATVGVEWRFTGVYDEAHDQRFNGVCATGAEVTVRGFTLIGSADGTFEMRRYIDWAGVLSQLGLTVNWRVPAATLDDEGRSLFGSVKDAGAS